MFGIYRWLSAANRECSAFVLDFVFFLLGFFVYCIDLRDEFLIASSCVAIVLAMIEESIADSGAGRRRASSREEDSIPNNPGIVVDLLY